MQGLNSTSRPEIDSIKNNAQPWVSRSLPISKPNIDRKFTDGSRLEPIMIDGSFAPSNLYPTVRVRVQYSLLGCGLNMALTIISYFFVMFSGLKNNFVRQELNIIGCEHT